MPFKITIGTMQLQLRCTADARKTSFWVVGEMTNVIFWKKNFIKNIFFS